MGSPLRTPPQIRRLRGHYQSGNSRAQSEPDLRLDPRHPAMNLARHFVALYDYDPRTMSPNPNAAQEELVFRKGQVLKVYGEQDMDGFYRGELNGRLGLVPGNMVTEMDVSEIQRLYGTQRHRTLDYEPYYGTSRRRRPMDLRGTHWPQNSSDPTLAAHYHSAYSDYESETGERYPPARAEDPRLRRMRFQQIKSRSYDIEDRGRADMQPSYRTPRRAWVGDSDYESRRYPSADQAFASTSDRGRNYYRGSLDRRERTRDYSAPARSPSEQEYLSRHGGRGSYDQDRPQFQLGEEASERDYYARLRDPRAAARTDRYRSDYDRRRVDDRFYEERRRYDYPPDDRHKAPVEDERYNTERRSSEYQDQSRQYYDRRERAGTSREVPYAPRERESDYYERTSERKRGSFRRGGRDNLEQSIKEAMREAPPRRMVAKFDYDPRELSPNVDAEQVELTFNAGDPIMVYGEMDEDGFYIGELGNKCGLVPSNFLEPCPVALPQPQSTTGTVAQDLQDARTRKDGVTFSDTAEQPSRKISAPAGPSAVKPVAKPAGAPRPTAKPTAAGKPMKKTDSTVGMKGTKKPGEGGAKSSPASQRKISQTAAAGKASAKLSQKK